MGNLRHWIFAGLICVGITQGSLHAQSVGPAPLQNTAPARTTVDVPNSVFKSIKIMDAGYQYFLLHGELEKANRFLSSMVSYVEAESARYGVQPESLITVAGVGGPQYWQFAKGQAAANASAKPQTTVRPSDESEGPGIMDCHKDSEADFSCMNIK